MFASLNMKPGIGIKNKNGLKRSQTSITYVVGKVPTLSVAQRMKTSHLRSHDFRVSAFRVSLFLGLDLGRTAKKSTPFEIC